MSSPSFRVRSLSRKRAQINVCQLRTDVPNLAIKNLLVPSFTVDTASIDTVSVLVKDLASLWNYPSSYQLIAHLSKHSGIHRNELVKSSGKELNEKLFRDGLIAESDVNTTLFYMDLSKLASILSDLLVLFGPFQLDEYSTTIARESSTEKTLPTVDRVFPDIGNVDKTLPLNHATFLALTPLTKLQVYKHEGTYRKVYGSSLTPNERELILRENNFSSYEPSQEGDLSPLQSLKHDSKKPTGRARRPTNLDPNQLDVTENILPGCGLIPRFNVNAVCRVPNYFVATNLMGITQQNSYYNSSDKHLRDLKLQFSDSDPSHTHINLLIPSGDQEPFLYKYYFYKHYRGPGTGAYKDAAVTSQMNKIRVLEEDVASSKKRLSHLPVYRVMKKEPLAKRPLKSLVHPYYSKENVEILIQRQRVYTEDFTNMEMLHNSNTFNVLVNSYREVAAKTWDAFYNFKLLDFEKLYLMQQREAFEKRKAELLARQEELQQKSDIQLPTPPELMQYIKPDMSQRFTSPTHHPEIIKKLPVNLRGDPSDPSSQIAKPIRYVAKVADKGTPGYINQIEVVKLPNANAIAWDNLRKYRRV